MQNLATLDPFIKASLTKNKITFPINDFEMLISELALASPHYILYAFSELGWNLDKTDLFNPRDIMDTYGVLPKYERLFYRLLKICQEENIFSNKDCLWVAEPTPQIECDLEEWKKKLQDTYPRFAEGLELFHRCAINLSGVLTGKKEGISLLFPGGDGSQMSKFYLNSPISEIINITAGQVMGFLCNNISSNSKLKILEIGAGTGSISSYLFPELSAEKAIYTFTDISPFFVQLGKMKFKQYSFIEYKCLDIGKEPVSQGFIKKGYDIIVACNVFHATPDLRACIRHAQELLAPTGIMLLIEGTYAERWLDLLFGLTEGWWSFQDTDIRPEYPLVSENIWSDLLREAGFDKIYSYLPGSDKSFSSHQHIIFAQLSQ